MYVGLDFSYRVMRRQYFVVGQTWKDFLYWDDVGEFHKLGGDVSILWVSELWGYHRAQRFELKNLISTLINFVLKTGRMRNSFLLEYCHNSATSAYTGNVHQLISNRFEEKSHFSMFSLNFHWILLQVYMTHDMSIMDNF